VLIAALQVTLAVKGVVVTLLPRPVAPALVAVTPAAMAFAATLEKSVAMASAQSLPTTVGVLT